ncbi:MAG: D-alanine--D-alanine ligase family protein [Planctomycetota bacterium]
MKQASGESGRAERRIRLGVLFGGESPEHDVSVASAREVLGSIDPERFEVRPVQISRSGRWQLTSMAKLLADDETRRQDDAGELAVANRPELERALGGEDPVDCVFLALHGGDGEDGRIQGLLECLKVPYTGSGVAASALCMDKGRFKLLLKGAGLPTPPWMEIRRERWQASASSLLERIGDELGWPCFVKSCNSGSSLGVFAVRTPGELERAVEEAFQYDDRLIVEPRVVGRELTCAVLGNSGSERLLPLPPVEIRPKTAEFFDYHAKYQPGASEELCPAPLDEGTTRRVQDLAIELHELAGCDGMSRADMILDEHGELHVLEVNTIPGLTPTSLLPQAARAAGLAFPELVERLIELAMSRYDAAR